MANFTNAKEGDPVGRSVLTELGARHVNGYRKAVAVGEVPSIGEILSLKIPEMEDSGEAARRLLAHELVEYPGREPRSPETLIPIVRERVKNVPKKP